MAHFPRGIAPELLLSQVKNTMPYLFAEQSGEASWDRLPPAVVLREYRGQSLDHFEYFRLCLSSHYLSCGTPVPTDVDNQIRQKLWPKELPLETVLRMVEWVLESRKWDFALVSSRFAYGAKGTALEKAALDGHLGEWFTFAAGAYCALKNFSAPEAKTKRDELLSEISDETRRHSEIFGSLANAGEGLGCLKTSASIAHNFGDLDRVMDMWKLGMEDPLRLEFYQLAVKPFDPNGKLRYLGRLWIAGELYKSSIQGSSMAFENHRHYALRKPKSLRQDPAFLVPTGPFFDDWGRRVARGLATPEGAPSEATLELFTILKEGWARQAKTVGYGRGLRGMMEVHPVLKAEGPTLAIPQASFEKAWSDAALVLIDDIPSRA